MLNISQLLPAIFLVGSAEPFCAIGAAYVAENTALSLEQARAVIKAMDWGFVEGGDVIRFPTMEDVNWLLEVLNRLPPNATRVEFTRAFEETRKPRRLVL